MYEVSILFKDGPSIVNLFSCCINYYGYKDGTLSSATSICVIRYPDAHEYALDPRFIDNVHIKVNTVSGHTVYKWVPSDDRTRFVLMDAKMQWKE